MSWNPRDITVGYVRSEVKRPITGFGVDELGDWFAVLGCGHRQHVRHQPPFINRPWVTTKAGRTSRLGHELDCVRCDRLELPDHVQAAQTTAAFTQQNIDRALARARVLGVQSWLRIVIVQGALRYRAPLLAVDSRLDANTVGIVPPAVACNLVPLGHVLFYFEAFSIPEPAPVTAEMEARAQY